MALVPLLQAELDRDHVRRLEAMKAREARVMEGVEGWKAMDLKAPTPGVGKQGVYDPQAAEPIYHTTRHVHHSFLSVDDEEGTIPAQWWRGSKFFLKVRVAAVAAECTGCCTGYPRHPRHPNWPNSPRPPFPSHASLTPARP